MNALPLTITLERKKEHLYKMTIDLFTINVEMIVVGGTQRSLFLCMPNCIPYAYVRRSTNKLCACTRIFKYVLANLL